MPPECGICGRYWEEGKPACSCGDDSPVTAEEVAREIASFWLTIQSAREIATALLEKYTVRRK